MRIKFRLWCKRISEKSHSSFSGVQLQLWFNLRSQMRTIRSKPAGNSIYSVSRFGRIWALFVGHCLWGEGADKGWGRVDRKASFLWPSITCAHTLAQSFARILRGLLSECYGGRLVPKCGETMEWHGVQIHWVTHYLWVQEIRGLETFFLH